MLGIMLEENLDMYLGYLGVEKKKYKKDKIFFAVIGFVLGLFIAVLIGSIMGYLLVPVMALMGYKFPYFKLKSSKGKQDVINSYLFPEFLQSFLALVGSSGNVYVTFLHTREYVAEPLRTELDKLIELIEYDNKREYYMDFASYVGTTEAFMVMDMIYQFSTVGMEGDSLEKVTEYIDNIQRNKADEVIQMKMTKMENVGLVPILISLLLVGGFTVTLFIILGSQALGK